MGRKKKKRGERKGGEEEKYFSLSDRPFAMRKKNKARMSDVEGKKGKKKSIQKRERRGEGN